MTFAMSSYFIVEEMMVSSRTVIDGKTNRRAKSCRNFPVNEILLEVFKCQGAKGEGHDV